MAKTRRSAARRSAKTAHNYHASPDKAQSPKKSPYILADETSNKMWKSDSKLRHAQISFIGSSMTPSRRDSGENGNSLGGSFPNEVIVEECHGQAPVDIRDPYTRFSISPDGSDSSEDIVVFNGRNSLRPTGRSSFVQTRDSRLSQSRFPPFGHRSKIATTNHRSQSGTSTLRPTYSESAEYLGKNAGLRVSQRLSKRSQQATVVQADYIANLRDHISDLDSSVSSRARNIDDDANGVWESTVEDSLDGNLAYFNSSQPDIGTTLDTDYVNTSSDPQHNSQQLSSKLASQSREQSSGAPEGPFITDSRWLSSSRWCDHEYSGLYSELKADDTSPRRTKYVELNESLTTERRGEYERISDQHGPVEMGSADMTDEQIAIRLTKQEELGLGSSKILLFGGGENFLERRHFHGRVFGLRATELGALASGNPGTLQKDNDNRTETINKSVSHYVCNSFDVVDRERQSLSRDSKEHRATLPIMLSDSDLENSMQRAWLGDRRKKRQRKQAREEMRAQGRLGTPGKPDLRSRPSEGASLDQVKVDIREFLLSDDVMLTLPPMDEKMRKMVHEIANAFNIKSKSSGKGRARHPRLVKTNRTILYDDATMSMVNTKLAHERFPLRLRKRSRKSGIEYGESNRWRRGKIAGDAVAYRDGEIVGAAAPELGMDNRGRAMLEKMGWSMGTALGASNNKGIMQPVVHVVKTTKAGLG